MHDIFDRLQAMGKRIHVAIFFHGDLSKTWSVLIEWKGDGHGLYSPTGTKLEIKRQGKSLEEALRSAWTELEVISRIGLGQGALEAPIEHTAISESNAEAAPKRTLED